MASNKWKVFTTAVVLIVSGAWRANAQNAQNTSSAESDSTAVKNNYGVLAGDTSVVKSNAAIYDAFEPEPATDAPTAPAAPDSTASDKKYTLSEFHQRCDQLADSATVKTRYGVSAGFNTYDLSYSFKNQAGSILTWRDFAMSGGTVGISRQRGGKTTGLNIGFAKGTGYCVDDDAMLTNFMGIFDMGASFSHADAVAASAEVYKESAGGLTKKLGVAFKRFDDTDMLKVKTDTRYPNTPTYEKGNWTTYWTLHFKPQVQYKLKLVRANKWKLDFDLSGGPSLYYARQIWHRRNMNCNVIGAELSLGGNVVYKYKLGKNLIFITEIYLSTDQGAYSSFEWGSIQGGAADKNGQVTQYLPRTWGNEFGLKIAFEFGHGGKGSN